MSPCPCWGGPSPGRISDTSTITMLNSDYLKEIRGKMLNNEEVAECSWCNVKDHVGLHSSKNTAIAFFKNSKQQDVLNNTNSDYSIRALKIRYLDIRFSNLCNYSCRTCGPKSSSIIAAELGDTNPVKKLTDLVPDYLEQILTYLPEIEVVNFCGGEPMLIKETWVILDELIRLKRTDEVIIEFGCNLSKIEFQGRNLIEYAKQFKTFNINCSIEDSGRRGEVIRNGSSWATVESNLKALRSAGLCAPVKTVVSILNAVTLAKFHRSLIESDSIDKNWFALNILIDPNIYSLKVLPPELKGEITLLFNEHIDFLKSIDANYRNWERAIIFMNSDDHYTTLFQDFVAETNRLDSLRNQDSFSIMTEFQPYL
jgi:hypothetical protein